MQLPSAQLVPSEAAAVVREAAANAPFADLPPCFAFRKDGGVNVRPAREASDGGGWAERIAGGH